MIGIDYKYVNQPDTLKSVFNGIYKKEFSMGAKCYVDLFHHQ